MKKCLFKWIPKESLDNSPILFAITENLVQEMAESNIGRRLSEKELHRLFYSFLEDDDVIGSRDNAMFEAILCAIKNENAEWSGVDEEFSRSQQKSK